jgi:hypothetical protein
MSINQASKVDISILDTKLKTHMNRTKNIVVDGLKKITQYEINQLDLNLSSKTNNILVKYLTKDMYKTHEDYKNLSTLMKAFDDAYIKQEKKQYKYFIENILNARYKDDYSRLIPNFNKTLQKVRNNFEISPINWVEEALENLIKYSDGEVNLERHQNLSKLLFNYNMNSDLGYLQQRAKIRGNKIYSKSKYHEYNNQDRVAIFLTFTLNKGYRKYFLKKEYQDSKRRKEVTWGDMSFLQENKAHKDTPILELLDRGYNELDSRMKYFNNNVKTAIKRHREKNNSIDKNETVTKITAFEFVKSVQFHTHLILFVNPDEVSIITEQFNNFMNHYEMNKYERKAQDLTIIDPEKGSATTYILKYILKQNENGEALEGMNKDEIDFYSKSSKFFGKKYNMIRMSKFKQNEDGDRLTQVKLDKIYNYLKSNYKDFIEVIKEQSKTPLYIILEQFYFNGIFKFIEEKRTRKTIDKKEMQEDYNSFVESQNMDIENSDDVRKLDKKINEIKKNFIFDEFDSEKIEVDNRNIKYLIEKSSSIKKEINISKRILKDSIKIDVLRKKIKKSTEYKNIKEYKKDSNLVYQFDNRKNNFENLLDKNQLLKKGIKRKIDSLKRFKEIKIKINLRNLNNKRDFFKGLRQNDLENEAKLSVIKNLSKYIEEENYTVITEAYFIKDENKINSILADYEIDYDFNFDLDDAKEEKFFYEDMLIMNYLPIQESMYQFTTAS